MSVRLFLLAAAVCSVAAASPAEEELKLRELKPIIEKLTETPNPEMSEFAYVAARGAALFTALAAYVDTNAANERDKKIAAEMQKRAVPYYQVAVAGGLLSKKDPDHTQDQIKLLLETYTTMIVRSKQLNNEILSPAILRDLEALKPIEPVIMELAENIENAIEAKRKK